jgi:pilus assembly protein Flp/PilA
MICYDSDSSPIVVIVPAWEGTMNIINWLLVLVSLGTRVAVRLIAAWHRRRRPLAAQGQGLVEYALILVLVAVIVIGILTTLGGRTSQVFDQISCELGGGQYHQDNGNGNSNKCK